jgi:regulator of protease activity HflC (stomatin/prohibitin superfamily)
MNSSDDFALNPALFGFGQILAVIILLIIVIAVIIRNVRVVPQAKAYVIERLGAYNGTWQVGLHFKIPVIDRIANKVSLKENVLDFPPQPVITKDNVTMEIDTVIYYQVTDPKLFTYGVEYPLAAIENLTATTLRNIIGDLELDESLTSREHINARMREVLDEATDSWGIKINRVEVKNITPPRDILSAMEKQMRAERERREAILRAEGEKRSSVLIAEGNKQATILEAEARKAAKILNAEATKEMQILEAAGEAEAILLVQKATADGIRLIVESAPTEQVIAIKGLEAFGKAADGKATKIIIPSNIQGLAGLATSVAELIRSDNPEEGKSASMPKLKNHSAMHE